MISKRFKNIKRAFAGFMALSMFVTSPLMAADITEGYLYSLEYGYGYEYSPVPMYPEGAVDLPLDGELSIVMDLETGIVIHGRGIHQRAYPASMTKVMTALLLLEAGFALHTPIIHTHEAINAIMPGSSHIAMMADEVLTVEEALYAIMLPSANDVSNAIAEFLGGTLENFALMMTARAHALGAVNTNFENAHGLPYPNHFTTPYDMALIMQEAVKHPLLLEVIATQRYYIPPTLHQPLQRPLQNTNRMIFPGNPEYNPDIVGGKTGWTTPSGHTLVSYGRRGDIGLITVVMGGNNRSVIFNDTTTLLEHGFAAFSPQTVFLADSFASSIDVIQRANADAVIIGSSEVYAPMDVVLNLPIEIDPSDVRFEVIKPDRMAAPLSAGFAVGRIDLFYDDLFLYSMPLFSADEVLELSPSEFAELLPSFDNPAPAVIEPQTQEELHDGLMAAHRLLSTMLNILLTAAVVLFTLFICYRFLRFQRKRKHYNPIKLKTTKKYDGRIMKNYRYRD